MNALNKVDVLFVGAGPSKDYDILGIKMFDSAELRIHPTGKAILKLGVQTQGQGHETTFAQIVAQDREGARARLRHRHVRLPPLLARTGPNPASLGPDFIHREHLVL